MLIRLVDLDEFLVKMIIKTTFQANLFASLIYHDFKFTCTEYIKFHSVFVVLCFIFGKISWEFHVVHFYMMHSVCYSKLFPGCVKVPPYKWDAFRKKKKYERARTLPKNNWIYGWRNNQKYVIRIPLSLRSVSKRCFLLLFLGWNYVIFYPKNFSSFT